MIRLKYREIPRPNEYPIIVKMKSPRLLYLFYKDHGFVYFGSDHTEHDSITGGRKPKQREMFTYKPKDISNEISMTTENGGKVVRYNEKCYYIDTENKNEERMLHDKYPVALIDKDDNIVLIYRKRAEHWTVRGEVYNTTFSELAKETDEEKYYPFQEENMYTGNGYHRIGEEENV